MAVMSNFTARDMDAWHKGQGSPASAAKAPTLPPSPPLPKVEFANVAVEPESEPADNAAEGESEA